MIPFIDLSREYETLQDEIDDAISRVLESGYFVLGDEVEAFEQEFADYVGVEHGVGVNSGTDALKFALDALGVGPGDEVVTVSHTFVATADAIVENGATPVFVDVDPKTYCMDTDQLKAAVTDDTAAIVPVHLYGQPVDMDTVLEVAERHDLAVVEDACQAHGAEYRGQRVGTFGDAACFSFYPVKNLGAYGDGGIVVTDDETVANHVEIARNVGQTEKYHHEMVGANSRLDELQAAILRAKLPHLDEWNERRREIAATYAGAFVDTTLVTPETAGHATHVYHLYVVRHERRDTLRDHLHDAGVQTLVHYPTPVHEQPSYRHLDAGPFPVTERVTDEILSLPMFPWMSKKEVAKVVDAVGSFE